MSGCPHIDLTSPDTYQGDVPREVFRYLRETSPVYWHEDPAQGVGFWAVTSHGDLDFVSKNPQLFSSAEKSCLLTESEPEMLALLRLQLINKDKGTKLSHVTS